MRRVHRRDVPLRRSLLVRLLVGSVLIVVCAIAATTWLVMHTTTTAIQRAQGQSLADNARIYDALLGYAARNPSWAGVHPTLLALANHTGATIVLTTPRRTPIASSGARSTPLPRTPLATVDPLEVDPALAPRATVDPIDSRSVGPFRLPRRERASLDALATRYVGCLQAHNVAARMARTPSGRPRVVTNGAPGRDCRPSFRSPTATERAALQRLESLANACLRHLGPSALAHLALNAAGVPFSPAAVNNDAQASNCIENARRLQLRRYVSPAALVFVGDLPGGGATSLDLSPSNRRRILEVVAIVLLLTVATTTLVARRLLRPSGDDVVRGDRRFERLI